MVGVTTQQTGAVRLVPRLRGAGHDVRILFLEASTQSLVKRYTESRRKHPLRTETGTVSEAIEHERDLLEPVRESLTRSSTRPRCNSHSSRRR